MQNPFTKSYQDENVAQRGNIYAAKTRTQTMGLGNNTGMPVKPLAVTANPTARVPLGNISNAAKPVQPVDQAAKKKALGVNVPANIPSRPNTANNYVMSDEMAPAPVMRQESMRQDTMMDLNLQHHYQQPQQMQQPQQQYQAQQQFQPQQQCQMDDMMMNDFSAPVEDANDAQLVHDYVNDIMKYLRDTEARRHPNPQYMTRQTDINAKMREILIDWLVEVHLKFKLRQETLFLTVNLIDRFLERRAVSRSKLQLVGCTAMLIASKYEEIYAPEVQDFVYVSDKAYTREQILAMESIMLNVLEFNVTVPYSMRFAERYTRLIKASDQFKEMVNFLIELTLQEHKFLNYFPSMIAASAVSLALHLSGASSWNPVLEQHTQYSESQIRQCVMDLWSLSAKDNPKYRAVRKKYSSSKFHGVAKITINPPPFETSM